MKLKANKKTSELRRLYIGPFAFTQANGTRRAVSGAIIAGFTVIEVMIVLAIAALILLVVFLAVPGLQRSQRNNARHTDVNRFSAAIISRVAATGVLPSTSADVTTIIGDVGTTGGYPALTVAGTLATAASGRVSLVASGGAAVAALGTGIIDGLQIVTAAQCTGTVGAATGVGATAKNIAIQYTLETSNSAVSLPVCQNAQ